MKKQISLFLLLSIFLSLHVQSQEEQLLIHTDRELYIAGEVIWFKLYAAQKTAELAFVDVISPQGIAIARAKILLKKRQGHGTLVLPTGLTHGYYKIRSYTSSLKEIGENVFGNKELIILNAKQPLVIDTAAIASIHTPLSTGTLKIAVQPNKTTFGQRENATITIKTTTADGQPVAASVSLSIALEGQARITSLPTWNTTANRIKEFSGLQMQGWVKFEKTGAKAPGIPVYLSFPGKTALVYAALTDELGHFTFLLPKLHGLRSVILQTNTKNKLPLVIELEKEFHTVTPINDTTTFALPASLLSIANTTLSNHQIQQAYQAFAPEPTFVIDNPFVNIPFYGDPEARYFLDDYTRFPLPEFFYEVVTQVRVKGKYGEERLSVVNDWGNEQRVISPLRLVDGVPVFEDATLLKINNQLIESADIVTSPFWLNPFLYDGVIQVTSFEGDARSFELPKLAIRRSYLTYLPERQFIAPDFANTQEQRLPHVLNTLHWNPTIQTDENGMATFTFNTADVLDVYTIHAVGISETGMMGQTDKNIEIVRLDK